MDRRGWLEERKKGIGGSDASAIIGVNPYKTNVELWEEKTGRRELEDISDKPYVQYGIAMESILRQSFAVKNPKYIVDYEENVIIKHPIYPFLFATLDGILTNKETGEKGVLEIKTKNFHSDRGKEDWKDGVPDNYFTQILHYMNVTGTTFAIVFAELTYSDDYQATKTYLIERKNHEEDIKYLQEKEIEFWKYVKEDKEPPLLLPEI